MEQPGTQPDSQEQTPKFRGLYRNANISVKSLDRIIIACLAVIIILVAFELRDPGFTISFDSRGGTDVPAQTGIMYGDPVQEPEPPTREGYRFAGWYCDASCQDPFDFETMIVGGSATLYAAWEPIE